MLIATIPTSLGLIWLASIYVFDDIYIFFVDFYTAFFPDVLVIRARGPFRLTLLLITRGLQVKISFVSFE